VTHDCPHCQAPLSGRIAIRAPMQWHYKISGPVFVCSSCGGRLYGNPHAGAKYLNAAFWLTLSATLYGLFSGATVGFVAGAAILFLLTAVAIWYVNASALRQWPAFRSDAQR